MKFKSIQIDRQIQPIRGGGCFVRFVQRARDCYSGSSGSRRHFRRRCRRRCCRCEIDPVRRHTHAATTTVLHAVRAPIKNHNTTTHHQKLHNTAGLLFERHKVQSSRNHLLPPSQKKTTTVLCRRCCCLRHLRSHAIGL